MYILANLLDSIWGAVRHVFLLIDSIGLTFIDDAYSLLIGAISAFDETAISDIARDITHNCYIIIGIFALFRIALLLVNSIINPDKLTEKQNGIGNMLVNIVITVVLLIGIPLVFDLSRELQGEIINKNYIPKLLIGQELVDSDVSKTNSVDSKPNPGKYMKEIATRSLIYPDDRVAIKDDSIYVGNNNCDADCQNAIAAWNNDVSFSTLETYIGTFTKVSGDNVYVYKYTPFVTLIVGGIITYVLLSFAIDIALRSVELAVLEILSPLFIVTYIDPKSASNGPFKKWVSTCGKTYVSLFIKIAIVCLMLLFIGNLDRIYKASMDSSGLLQLLILLAILLFAKKAPKWIGDMLGVEGAGLGELGIGKKLAGAALVGGLIGKGAESARNFAKQKGKNFVGNRIRNTAARIGGMAEAHAENKKAKEKGTYDRSNRQSLWKQGRAAAKNSRVEHWGQNTEGLLNALTTGYMSGRLNVDPNAKSLNEKHKERAKKAANEYNNAIGNTASSRAEAQEIEEKNTEAKKMYGDIDTSTPNGDREKIVNSEGKEVYVQPVGKKEMNEAFENPISEFGAFETYGTNLVKHRGYTINSTTGKVEDSNGKIIANSVAEFGMNNMSYSGKLAIKSLVADNVKAEVQRFQTSRQNLQLELSNYSKAMNEYNGLIKDFNANPLVVSATAQISKYEALVSKLDDIKQKYENIQKDPDYVSLQQKDYNSLTTEEKNRLATYNVNSKKLLNEFNGTQTQIKEEQKAYDAATQTIETEKSLRGIDKAEINIEGSKRRVEEWAKEVRKMENKISDSTEIISINDKGEIEKDSSGNVIKKRISDLYKVKINGETLSPIDNFVRIEEIKTELDRKSEKAKSKYDESLKDASNDKK